MFFAKLRLENYETGEVIKFEGNANQCLSKAMVYLENKSKKRNVLDGIMQQFRKEKEEFNKFWQQ